MKFSNIEKYIEKISQLDPRAVYFPKTRDDYQRVSERKETLNLSQSQLIKEISMQMALSLKEKEPSHMKLYALNLCNAHNFNIKEIKFIFALIELKLLKVDGTFVLTPKKKKMILNHLKLKYISFFSDVLKSLQSTHRIEELEINMPIIFKLENGEFEDGDKYFVNPFLIASGPWHEIREKRLMVILDVLSSSPKVEAERVTTDSPDELKSADLNWWDKDDTDFDDDIVF